MDLLKATMSLLFKIVNRTCATALRLVSQNVRALGSAAPAGARQMDLMDIRRQLEKFDGGSVDLEMDDNSGIAVMTLNNPRRLNSLTGKMMVDMSDHVERLEKWEAGKGLVLVGANGNFCSGGDLTFVRKALHFGEEMAAFQHETLTRLLNLPLISVALLQGHTLGGGAELSTACDFRVMSSSARVGFVQIRMGITNGWGGSTRLIRLIGRQRALALMASARVLSPEEAKQEGLVEHVLSYSMEGQDELHACTDWLKNSFCQFGPEVTRAVKASVVNCHVGRDVADCLDFERVTFGKLWGGPVQQAALAAKIKHK